MCKFSEVIVKCEVALHCIQFFVNPIYIHEVVRILEISTSEYKANKYSSTPTNKTSMLKRVNGVTPL